VWHENGWYGKCYDLYFPLTKSELKEIEFIGNRFDNPELLEAI